MNPYQNLLVIFIGMNLLQHFFLPVPLHSTHQYKQFLSLQAPYIQYHQLDMSIIKQALLPTTTTTFRFLRPAQIKWLNFRVEGPTQHFVKDETMLASAADAPANNLHYAEVRDPVVLAAVLAARVVRNHPFANGNKRTGLLAANAFLAQTGKVPQQDPYDPESNDLITKAHTDVAMGTLDEEALASIYRKCLAGRFAATNVTQMTE
ncbi:MAG: hypothetical protein Q9208_005925 [Pyrenodesmia sp. 3 TL-2023]